MRLKFILFLAILFVANTAHCYEKESIAGENRLLEAELKLARKPDIYFVFNLKDKIIRIRSRGILLRGLVIQDVKYWGSPLSDKPYLLLKKSTFLKPGREKIKPGESKEKDDFEIDALELDDMPSKYVLSMDGGLSISVKPATGGVISWLCNVYYSAKRKISRPLFMFWNAVLGKPYIAVDIVLDGKEARALYWSLSEGAACIVYPP
ncbi:MAG: hypothetical protein AB1632_10230 [Nitrospirota bacterium]